MQQKVLIVSGHTNLQVDSVANKNIITNLKELLPSSTIIDLGSMDYKFDVKKRTATTFRSRYYRYAISTILVFVALSYAKMGRGRLYSRLFSRKHRK